MAHPQLPPPVEIDVETKRTVIEGLKKVIEAFQAKGLLANDLSYQDIIHDPAILNNFIRSYRANRKLVDKLVVDAEGKPVTDDTKTLLCGVSLEQIQQLLVRTCSKYYFDSESQGEEETIIEHRTTTRFLIFKKTEAVERKANSNPVDERKNRELVKFMAFDWQLPLLPVYSEALTYMHVVELDVDLLAMPDADCIRLLGQYDPAVLKKVRAVALQDFSNLVARPAAIAGAAVWNRDMYVFYRNLLADKAFTFFAREKSFFNVVADLDKPLARTYGDVLCYVASENLQEMQRLNIDKAGVLIEAMRAALGDKAAVVLAIPTFSKDILRKLVESLLHMNQEKDQLAMSTQLTCKAIAPQVLEWLARQPNAAAIAARIARD